MSVEIIIGLGALGVALAAYAVVLWLTDEGGPCDIARFWDEGR